MSTPKTIAWKKAHPLSVKKYNRDWYEKNIAIAKAKSILKHLKIRIEVLAQYGGKCTCCGETEIAFLTLDHVHNDGAQHRKSIGSGIATYYWAKKNNYPSSLQILCWNCNCAKTYRGVCPHQEKSK